MNYKSQKRELKRLYGSRCMLCERELAKKECTYHHVVPKSCGGSATVENGAILCEHCQTHIHKNEYGSIEYTRLTRKIYRNMNKHKRLKIGA